MPDRSHQVERPESLPLAGRVTLVVASLVVWGACGPRDLPQPHDAPATADMGAADRGAADPCDAEENDVWAAACRRGVTFRAMGQEPGWLLEIGRDRHMLLSTDYGENRVEAMLDAPARQGQQLTYSVRTDAGPVTITIAEETCTDIMSGEAFPTAVTVTVAGRRLDGCGRPLGVS
jgi:uncharacterized membrane protein